MLRHGVVAEEYPAATTTFLYSFWGEYRILDPMLQNFLQQLSINFRSNQGPVL
jgi:hypothetical protein